ncbi:hypothetical protein NIES2101_08790 [Calothrix sp. HK-06]|nr:hypothetical protein NIES2101_08790 [Calothrix sp. HK-06]
MNLVLNCYRAIAATALTTIAVTSQVTTSYGITFVTQSSTLQDNDQLDWSSLGVQFPFKFLQN